MKYDLGVIQSNIENMLIQALEAHEKAIQAYGEAVDAYSIDFANYRRAKADAIKELKFKGEKVTIILSLADGLVYEYKQKELHSEGQMKKAKMICEGLIERIQGIKFIGNRVTNQERLT